MHIAPTDRKLLASLAALVALGIGFSAIGGHAFGVQVAHAQFAPPTCVPPLCSPAVIQNISLAGTTQTAGINISGDAKLGATFQAGANSPVLSLATDNLMYGNVGATSVNGSLMLLQFGAVDRLRVTLAGQMQLPLGAVGAPSYSFVGNTTTGFYAPAASQVAVTTGGAQRMLWSAAGSTVSVGQLTIPVGTAALPSLTFAGDTNAGIFHSAADTINITTNGVSRVSVDPTGIVNIPGNLVVGGTFTATLAGDGSQLTNLNASNIASGTLADARLSSNVALLNGTQTFSGANTFSNASNSFTGNGAGLTGINASNVTSGTLPDAQLSANVDLLNATQIVTGAKTFSNASNSFTGNGAGLTGISASNITTGTLPAAQMPAAVAYTNAIQTFTAANTFSSASNAFTGSGAGLTALNGTNISSGTVADARLSANIPKLNAANAFTGNNTFSGMTTLGAVGLVVGAGQNLLYGNISTSSTGSLLLLQKNSIDQFRVDAFGNLTSAGSGSFATGLIVNGTAVCLANGVNCPPTVNGSGTVNYMLRFTPNGNTIGNSIIQDNGTNIGVNGAPTGTDLMTVYGNVYANGQVTGYNTAGNGVYGQSTVGGGIGVTGTGSGYGVYGFTTTAGANGVYGSNSGGFGGSGVTGWSNGNYGVQGIATGSGSQGVYGSGNGTGVYGIASGAGGAGVSGTSPHYGIYGASSGTGPTDYPIVAQLPAGGTASAIAGFAVSSSGNGVTGSTIGSGMGVVGTTGGTGYGGSFQTTTANGTALLATGFGVGKAILANGDTQLNGILTTNSNTNFGFNSGSTMTVKGSIAMGSGANGGTLTVGSVAADPAGVNGMVDYNTGNNKFHCFENGAWVNCISAGITGGTTNTIPKYTSSTTLGNSLVSDNGTVVTTSGNSTVTGQMAVNGASQNSAYGISTTGSTAGVYGNSATYGVYGNSPTVFGVYGTGPQGVNGNANGYVNGTGVYGSGTYGVQGSGTTYGGQFITSTAGGQALNAQASAPATTAISAVGDLVVTSGNGTISGQMAVNGATLSSAYGISANGSTYGVYGNSPSGYGLNGNGVVGVGGSGNGEGGYFTGGTYGVYAATGNSSGVAVFGNGWGTNGYGVEGVANGSGGTGVVAMQSSGSYALQAIGTAYFSGDIVANSNTWGTGDGWHYCALNSGSWSYCTCANGTFVGNVAFLNTTSSTGAATYCYRP